MTGPEATAWLFTDPQGMHVRLPAIAAWCQEHRKTVAIWILELWHDLAVEDCHAVGKQLTADGVDIPPWQMDGFGALVRRKAKEIEATRERRRAEGQRKRPVDRRGSMACALSDIIGQRLDGAQRAAVLSREFPDDQDGQRFRCAECGDSGLVTIFDPECVHNAFRVRAELTAENHRELGVRIRTAVAACNCVAGRRFADRDPNIGGVILPRMSKDFVHANGCTRKQLAKELVIHLETWRPPGYHEEFDQWNRGELATQP